jgi:protoheme IX farnesyltransferase
MLPSVASLHETAVKILRYTVVLVALSLLFAWTAHLGWIYVGAAVVLGAMFLWLCVRLLRDETTKSAMKVFTFSITYATLLFGAMALDQLVAHA